MSAKEQMAAMLDELMGKQRNAAPDERRDATFEDEDVCKFFLAGYCPNELFINTKADLGPCKSEHDPKLKEAYQQSDKFERLGYEEEFIAFLQRMVNDMERKIRKHRDRLDLTQPGGQPQESNKDRLEEKLRNCDEQIQKHLTEAEQLGAEGKVDEAQQAISVSERYKTEKDNALRTLNHLLGNPGASPDEVKPMEVCDICACFLIVGDAQSRVDEHYVGKQHLGYAKLRATLQELERRREEKLRLKREAAEERARAERDAATRTEEETRASSSHRHSSDSKRDTHRSSTTGSSSRGERDKDRRSDRSDRRSDRDRSDRGSDRDRHRDRDSKRKRSRSRSPVRGGGDRDVRRRSTTAGGGDRRDDKDTRRRGSERDESRRKRSPARTAEKDAASRHAKTSPPTAGGDRRDVKRSRSPRYAMADVVSAVEAHLMDFAAPPNRRQTNPFDGTRSTLLQTVEGQEGEEDGNKGEEQPEGDAVVELAAEGEAEKEKTEKNTDDRNHTTKAADKSMPATGNRSVHDPSEREDEADRV